MSLLAIILLAATTVGRGRECQEGNAPESLGGHFLHYHLARATGIYTHDKGREFLVTFTADGHYTDTEPTGAVTDEGTYTHRVSGPNTMEVTYHPGSNSAQQVGGDYTEVLLFQTPKSGTVNGTASTAPGDYRGTFFVTTAPIPTAAATPECSLTPEDLGGVSLLLTTERTSGWCSGMREAEFMTTFGSDGTYVDIEKQSGLRSDLGTYEYKRLNGIHAQVVFHVSSGGTWTGHDYVDVLHFLTPNSGTYHGWQTSGDCTYEGRFFVQP